MSCNSRWEDEGNALGKAPGAVCFENKLVFLMSLLPSFQAGFHFFPWSCEISACSGLDYSYAPLFLNFA